MKYTVIRKVEDKEVDKVFKKYSLRELGKLVDCDFAYLSKIKNGVLVCSERLYLKLKKLAELKI